VAVCAILPAEAELLPVNLWLTSERSRRLLAPSRPAFTKTLRHSVRERVVIDSFP